MAAYAQYIRVASRMGLLILLAVVRQIFYFVEQPSSSLLELDPYISHVLSIGKIIQPIYRRFLFHAQLCMWLPEQAAHTFIISCHVPFASIDLSWMGCWGHFSAKGSIGMGSLPGP